MPRPAEYVGRPQRVWDLSRLVCFVIFRRCARVASAPQTRAYTKEVGCTFVTLRCSLRTETERSANAQASNIWQRL